MKKYLLLLSAFALSLSFTACHEDDEPSRPKHQSPFAFYILGEGNNKNNDASLSGVTESGELTTELYYTANGQLLGDLANDLVYSSTTHCLYTAVSSSLYIAKLDERGKELARFALTQEQGDPRSLALHGPYLYASTYGKIVAVLDTATLTLQTTIPVGSYSEEIAVCGDMLAVCNSGRGEENTLSLIDLSKASTNLRDLRVTTVTLPNLNPQNIIAQGGRFYCNTTEYDANWNASNTIVEINPADGSTTTISQGAFYMAPAKDGKVLLIASSTDWTTYETTNTFSTYDPSSATTGASFLSAAAEEQLRSRTIYGIDVDSEGRIYILCTNTDKAFKAIGSSLFVLSAQGELLSSIADTDCRYASSLAFVK